MKRILLVPALAGVALLSVACAKEPTDALNAAKAAFEAAKTAGASDYAAPALAAAETASAALDAELKAQAEKFALTRSYTKAAELAAAAKTAADQAAAAAVTGKEQMKAEATTLIAGVRGSVDAAKQALAKAPKGKGSAADLEAMAADVAGVETALGDMDAAMTAGNFKGAKAKAEAAKATLNKIVADVRPRPLPRRASARFDGARPPRPRPAPAARPIRVEASSPSAPLRVFVPGPRARPRRRAAGAEIATSGRTRQPVDLRAAALAAHEKASGGPASSWAPEELAVARGALDAALVDCSRQENRLFVRRDFRPASAALERARALAVQAEHFGDERREEALGDAEAAVRQARALESQRSRC